MNDSNPTSLPNHRPRLLTVKQAASSLGLQYRQLLDAVNKGLIPFYQVGTGHRLVQSDEIIQLIKRQNGAAQND